MLKSHGLSDELREPIDKLDEKVKGPAITKYFEKARYSRRHYSADEF